MIVVSPERFPLALILVLAIASSAFAADVAIVMVVMDPLAKPLSCPCVEGYAQRDYEALDTFIEQRTGYEVEIVFLESLQAAIEGKTDRRADLVIGKASVVVADAAAAGLQLSPVARLSGKDGRTTQTGLVVVRASDRAHEVTDLVGYRILFGPAECDEKHSAVLTLLQRAGMPAPETLETTEACSDGACKVIEWGDSEKAAAVISSYAKPLLEGCGTIEKGELRVIAETDPVPFITAFVNADLPEPRQAALTKALLAVVHDDRLCEVLESLQGFVPLAAQITPAALKKN